jgi:hypothetical protein
VDVALKQRNACDEGVLNTAGDKTKKKITGAIPQAFAVLFEEIIAYVMSSKTLSPGRRRYRRGLLRSLDGCHGVGSPNT